MHKNTKAKNWILSLNKITRLKIYILLASCGSHLQTDKLMDWGHMEAKEIFLRTWETPRVCIKIWPQNINRDLNLPQIHFCCLCMCLASEEGKKDPSSQIWWQWRLPQPDQAQPQRMLQPYWAQSLWWKTSAAMPGLATEDTDGSTGLRSNQGKCSSHDGLSHVGRRHWQLCWAQEQRQRTPAQGPPARNITHLLHLW